jgi:hypothetical protein
MANTLSKSGIANNTTIEAWHVTQSIDAFTGVSAYDITISGSLTLTGSTNLSGSTTIVGGDLSTRGFSNATASWATNAVNAPTKVSGEYITSGSTTGVIGDLKIAAGYGEILTGNTFVDLTFNTLNTNVLGVDCFVSVGISSSYTTGSMAHFPRVASLAGGVMRFSMQSTNASAATPFFYTIIYR